MCDKLLRQAVKAQGQVKEAGRGHSFWNFGPDKSAPSAMIFFFKLAYAAPGIHGNGLGNLSSVYGVPP